MQNLFDSVRRRLRGRHSFTTFSKCDLLREILLPQNDQTNLNWRTATQQCNVLLSTGSNFLKRPINIPCTPEATKKRRDGVILTKMRSISNVHYSESSCELLNLHGVEKP
jgi:hypothetical protein